MPLRGAPRSGARTWDLITCLRNGAASWRQQITSRTAIIIVITTITVTTITIIIKTIITTMTTIVAITTITIIT